MKKKFMAKEGFTLVELIVVIAILGILAAVAVPAYSGYVTKAKEAGDTQIVSAVNTAFAAACVENGVQPKDYVQYFDATVSNGAPDLAVKTGTGAPTGDTLATANKIDASFDTYYAGNSGLKLEYYNAITAVTVNSAYTGNFEGKKTA